MARILGINDEQTVCDCCGKKNLKRTVIIDKGEGEIVRYGTTCASKVFHCHEQSIKEVGIGMEKVKNLMAEWLDRKIPLWKISNFLQVKYRLNNYIENNKIIFMNEL